MENPSGWVTLMVVLGFIGAAVVASPLIVLGYIILKAIATVFF